MPDAPPTKVSVTNVGKSPYEALIEFQRVVYSPTALRFFFCKTLQRNYPIEGVPYPKAPRKLPIILTHEEAVRSSIQRAIYSIAPC